MRALYASVAFLVDHASRWSSKKLGCALVYHRVEHEPPRPLGQLVPVVSSEDLKAHARYLLRRYRVVPASELPRAVARRRRGGRFPVAITFDDDLASHAEIAAPILRNLGLTATFFLCGASLHEAHDFWWDRLERAVASGVDLSALPPAAPLQSIPSGDRARQLASMAAHIEEMSPSARAQLSEELAGRLGPDPHESGLRAEQVRELVAAGFEIGFHTRHHDPLDTLDDVDLDRALRIGRSELEDLSGAPVTVIAYPHGRADARVAAAAVRAGYSRGFTTDRAAVRVASDVLLLGRIDPSGRTLERFVLMLSRTFLTSKSTT